MLALFILKISLEVSAIIMHSIGEKNEWQIQLLAWNATACEWQGQNLDPGNFNLDLCDYTVSSRTQNNLQNLKQYTSWCLETRKKPKTVNRRLYRESQVKRIKINGWREGWNLTVEDVGLMQDPEVEPKLYFWISWKSRRKESKIGGMALIIWQKDDYKFLRRSKLCQTVFPALQLISQFWAWESREVSSMISSWD